MRLGGVLGTLGLWAGCALGAAGTTTTGASDPVEGLRAELAQVRARPDKSERWVQEARLLFYIAEYSPGDEKQLAIYTEGRDLAKKARAAAPADSGAILWWAANHGGMARLKKNLWSLGALKEIEAALTELKELDPQFGFAAASRVLGKIYLEAPRILSIGSSSKAKESMLDSMKRAPEFPGNELGYAEWLLEDGEKDKASAIVQALRSKGVLEKGDYGDFRWEKKMWRERFDELLRKTQGNLP